MRTRMTKTRSESRRTILAACLVVMMGTVALTAHAQSASGQAPAASPGSATAQKAAPGSTSENPAPKTAPKAGASKDDGLIEKVKTWVVTRWNELNRKWGAQPASKTVAGKPTSATSSINKSHGPSAPQSSPTTGHNLAVSGSPNAIVNNAGAGAKQAGTGTTSSSGDANSGTVASRQPAQKGTVYSGLIVRDLPRSPSGVAVYHIDPAAEAVPRLDIGREETIRPDRYRLDKNGADAFDRMAAHQQESPVLLSPKQMADLVKPRVAAPGQAVATKTVFFEPKGRVSREGIDTISIDLAAERKFELAKFVPLTQDELRFLSGLLLYQQGDKCAVAVGLFHHLAKSKPFAAEGNYYLAMCSKRLGLMTDFIERARRIVELRDVYYINKILPEIPADVPYEHLEPFGKALLPIANSGKILSFPNETVAGNIYYILANYGAQTENFKVAARFGSLVPESHPLWAQSQFLMALGEYQSGSKSKALELQEALVERLASEKAKAEFRALVSINLARMYFQEKKFKQAHEWFLKVYKDHPLWLQSLTEMGWAQLMSGDFEGAIGNMYSVQSPYFSAVYKPESYVIRTIGYLNLCQYGDAYRTLTVLEKQYRPWLEKISSFQKTAPEYYATVRRFVAVKTAEKEIDGLPSQVIREMARHKDYINLQNALNRQIDEREAYKALDGEVDKSLKRARWMVTNSRKRADELRAKLASIKKNPSLEANRLVWKAELDNELDLLNGYFFEIDLFNEAKESLQAYKNEVVGGAEQRIVQMRSRIETTLATRLKRMRTDLERMLENNELLRYEVFAGSGENIRYQVAGGEKGNRVPASVIPQSKSLKWDFDGEYWEDEVGHYRSSLKNNCPDANTQEHASL